MEFAPSIANLGPEQHQQKPQPVVSFEAPKTIEETFIGVKNLKCMRQAPRVLPIQHSQKCFKGNPFGSVFQHAPISEVTSTIAGSVRRQLSDDCHTQFLLLVMKQPEKFVAEHQRLVVHCTCVVTNGTESECDILAAFAPNQQAQEANSLQKLSVGRPNYLLSSQRR